MERAVRALLVALTVVLACCACRGGKEAPVVRVPDLHGLSTQAALDRLAEAKLCVGRVDVDETLGSGPGPVVAQRPRAGSRVEPLHRVSFRTSGAASGVEIVDVVTAEGCPAPEVPVFRFRPA
jgi:beta-lactam-binding protein with PASTA domain